MTKTTDKLYDKFFRVIEALWTDMYAHDLPIPEIRETLLQDMKYLLDEMEMWERQIGRTMTRRQKEKLR